MSSSTATSPLFRMIVLALWAGLAMPLVPAHAGPPLGGRQIMDEVSRRQQRQREFDLERMTLISDGQVEATRLMRRYIMRTAQGTYRYLIVYDSPAGIAGTAALTWQVKDGPDDQWLYLPALGQLKRIIGGARRQSFMGTDFAFEDLSVENEDDYAYDRLADQTLDGKPVYVIHATPKSADVRETTDYSARNIYVQTGNFLVLRIDYFSRDSGKLMKTLNVLKARQISGDTWRATEYVMTNHLEDHATRVETLNTSFDAAKAPDEVFEQHYLVSRAHMR